jgi:hypothetical protein
VTWTHDDTKLLLSLFGCSAVYIPQNVLSPLDQATARPGPARRTGSASGDALRYRIYINRYLMLISYTISKVFLAFDIDSEGCVNRGRYRRQYSIHPMSFTAEWKLPGPLPRLHHTGAKETQRHEPWIPETSFCGFPQLDPQRFISDP